MSDSKILKNTTVINITLKSVGFTVPLLGQLDISKAQYHLFAIDDALAEINPYLVSGALVVNDGLTDLTANEGYRFLEMQNRPIVKESGVDKVKYPRNINFKGNVHVNNNPDGTAEVSVLEDVNDLTGNLLTLNFVHDGGVENKWLELLCHNINGEEVHYRFPFNVQLVAISYTNKKDDTAFKLEIYKSLPNGGVTISKIFELNMDAVSRRSRNFTRRNADNTNVSALTDVQFSIGEKIGVYVTKGINGDQPDDMQLDLIFRISSSPLTNTLENYDGKFEL